MGYIGEDERQRRRTLIPEGEPGKITEQPAPGQQPATPEPAKVPEKVPA